MSRRVAGVRPSPSSGQRSGVNLSWAEPLERSCADIIRTAWRTRSRRRRWETRLTGMSFRGLRNPAAVKRSCLPRRRLRVRARLFRWRCFLKPGKRSLPWKISSINWIRISLKWKNSPRRCMRPHAVKSGSER